MATGDEYRLVRVRAAAGIAAFPRMAAPPAYQAQLKKANEEYLASITARPDQWTSHYNMGNYQLGRGELQRSRGLLPGSAEARAPGGHARW
ncbi:MAG: hypothetical protein M0C28_32800 [Candidatus Moduliflexus flocculans]|nr:hypothetical protein [Candidatus Moduliflexus flocculans]